MTRPPASQPTTSRSNSLFSFHFHLHTNSLLPLCPPPRCLKSSFHYPFLYSVLSHPKFLSPTHRRISPTGLGRPICFLFRRILGRIVSIFIPNNPVPFLDPIKTTPTQETDDPDTHTPPNSLCTSTHHAHCRAAPSASSMANLDRVF